MLNTLLYVLSSLALVATSANAGSPPCKRLTPLLPHPRRAGITLFDPRSSLIKLIPTVENTPGEAIVYSANKRSPSAKMNNLHARAMSCQTTGYTLCANQLSCCPAEGTCCSTGGCCDNRFMCCASGGCCPDGYTCASVSGQNGCCPTGQTCSAGNNECANASYVVCEGENFCCPPGEACWRDASGQPACGDATVTSMAGMSSAAFAPSRSAPATTAAPSSSTSTKASAASTTTQPAISTSVVIVVPSSSSSSTSLPNGGIPTTMINAHPVTALGTVQASSTSSTGPINTALNPVGNSASTVGRNVALMTCSSIAVVLASLL